jgi:hypothetical protein
MPHLKKKNKEKKEIIKLIDIRHIRFSPEFEFELPAKLDSDKLIERGKTLKGWTLKSDGSLQNGIELSPENPNHLYYNEDSLMQIKEILALVRVYKAKALPSCGLHIHISVKSINDKQILTIIREWVHKQKFIAKRFKVSKERLAETCKLLPKSQLHKLTVKEIHQFRNNLRTSFRSYGYLDEKYYSLNASHLPKSDYQTLEFRMFSSTTNFREIKEVIYFVLTFIKESLERE